MIPYCVRKKVNNFQRRLFGAAERDDKTGFTFITRSHSPKKSPLVVNWQGRYLWYVMIRKFCLIFASVSDPDQVQTRKKDPVSSPCLHFFKYYPAMLVKKQWSESESGWMRNFFLDPKFFISYPDPGKNKTRWIIQIVLNFASIVQKIPWNWNVPFKVTKVSFFTLFLLFFERLDPYSEYGYETLLFTPDATILTLEASTSTLE